MLNRFAFIAVLVAAPALAQPSTATDPQIADVAVAEAGAPETETSPEVAEPASETSPEIVVEAPPTELERRRELRKMVSGLIRNPRAGRTVATFLKAPCPRVFGLPEKQAGIIERRILANAAALGVNRRNPQKNCKFNVSVIFVPESEGPAESWFNDDSKEFAHLLSFERHRILNEKGPVRAWSYDVVRGADGLSLPDTNGRRIDNLDSLVNKVPFATRLSSPIQVEIGGSVVMIAMSGANGKTLNQLADYATMRALANLGGIDPDTVPAAPTILTLFHDDEAAKELTNFDRAFLSKLYDTNRNSKKQRFYSVIAARAANSEREAGLAPGQALEEARREASGSRDAIE